MKRTHNPTLWGFFSEEWNEGESNCSDCVVFFVFHIISGPSWPWSYGSWIYNYLCNQCLSPLMWLVRISIRARCTTLCDKICLLTCGRSVVFSATPVSSTNKTDRHDITEILLKVALNTINQTKPIFIKMKIIDILSIMQIKGYNSI